MKENKFAAILLAAMLVLTLLSGCKKGEEYVQDLDSKLVQAERVADEALAKVMEIAATQLQLDRGGEEHFTWENIKGYLDYDSRTYLGNLGENCYSHKTPAASFQDGGWIRVRQGWILITKEARWVFTYSTREP